MLLERIEIDTRGPLGLVQLGPFSPGLNAILGPVVRGQSVMSGDLDALAGLPVGPFLQALMLGSRSPQRTLGGWSGRVVWADSQGLLHCRRELDGTLQGRLAVDFEPRDPAGYDLPAASQTGQYLRRRLAQLPPSIVEAVVAEPDGGGSIFATLRAAHRAGLDTVTQRSALQAEQRREIERLQSRAAQLQQRIESIAVGDQTIGQLHDRRDQLQAEYESLEQMLRAASEQRQADQTHQRGRQQRLLELRDDARRLREQESELRRSLADIEAALRTITFDPLVEHPRVAVAETHRRQLEDLDGQLLRWRRTLAEVRGMRDQLARVATIGSDAESAVPLRSLDDWDARLEAAHRQIDWLTIRYAYGDPLDDDETCAAPEQQPWSEVAGAPAGSLTSQLRTLKIDLAQLGTRLARGAMHDADGSLESARAQLQRCESDLLDSIARLVRQRHRLLRRIAQTHQVPAEQLAAAFGDWSHCQDHPHLYQWLLSEGTPVRATSREANDARARRLEADRVACSHELDRTVNRLENCLAEIESLRKACQLQLTDHLQHWPTQRRDSVLAELVAVRARLNDLETRQQLIAQRDQLRHQVRQIRPTVHFESTLAQRASHWLARLSGGRLQRIQWDPQVWDPSAADTMAYHAGRSDVRIDGRSAAVWSRADQALATLAVRMATADALAERGAGIPLLVEVPTATSLTAQPLNHRDAWDIDDHRHTGNRWETSVGGATWIDTVIAYADSGRQTILLTGDRRIADRVANAGGRVQSLTAQSYAVPRSIYAYRSAPQPAVRPRQQDLLPEINRDLDMAWREAYGFYDDPAWYRGSHASTDRFVASRDGYPEDYRDGAYFRSGAAALRPYAPAVPTADAAHLQNQTAGAQPVILPVADDRLDAAPGSPFFLTTDSPVDQAPSVDAVAAARLRSLRVTRVGHLLTADPIRLAEALGMPDVSAAAIRRWQHEARLVCQVPQLRGFDARLLVGCGITDPQQLAAMHPGQLLEKVEAFLATDRGRQILRSGSSYELSRITSWIAAANRSVARSSRHGQRPVTPSGPAGRQTDDRQSADRAADADHVGDRARDAQTPRRRRPGNGPKAAGRRSVVPIAAAAATTTLPPRRNFYLDRHSPIVDAPSIGPRTAGRLQQLGVHTVADLLQDDAARLAERLGSKRIDAKTVRAWQQQATLMCRVPMLRGYEAALLVAVDIHKPERLASWDADQLLSKIRKLVGTAEGKRILRGASEPDLQKVSGWIRNAQHRRALHAA